MATLRAAVPLPPETIARPLGFVLMSAFDFPDATSCWNSLNISPRKCAEPNLTEQWLYMSFDVAAIDLERGCLLRGPAVGDDDGLPQVQITKLRQSEVCPLDGLRLDRILAIHDLTQEAAGLSSRGLDRPRRAVATNRRPALAPVR